MSQTPPSGSTLRELAEHRLGLTRADVSSMTPDDIETLVHGFQVHQVQLQLQNEELQKAQEELRLARDRCLELYQFAPAGLLTLDAEHVIVRANRTAGSLLGVPGMGLIGRRFESLAVDSDADACFLFLRHAEESVSRPAQELKFRRADGSPFWASLSAVLSRPSGAEALIEITLVDVTGRRAAIELEQHAREEQLLRSANEELRRRADQLAGLALELTQAEHRERQRLGQALHDGLQQLLVAAQFRLSALERDTSGNVRQEAVRIGKVLSESIETCRALSVELCPPILWEGGLAPALEWLVRWMNERFGMAVDLEVGTPIEPTTTDENLLLFQAIREILFNVVKHSGVLRARVRADRLGDVARVLIEDDGAGFDPGRLRSRGGTEGGYGLFSIEERLELLGGSLQIDSAPGRGSRFLLTMPLQAMSSSATLPVLLPRVEPSADGASAASRADSRGRIRVVLVDDHVLVRQGLTTLLRQEPDMVIVGEASDGESAVDVVRKVNPDVVLMDVSLPGLNGIDATRVIHAVLPDVRVIGLSMFQDAARAEAMRQAGAVDFVSKSGPSETLLATVRSRARI